VRQIDGPPAAVVKVPRLGLRGIFLEEFPAEVKVLHDSRPITGPEGKRNRKEQDRQTEYFAFFSHERFLFYMESVLHRAGVFGKRRFY
jgi:hypothetical protein